MSTLEAPAWRNLREVVRNGCVESGIRCANGEEERGSNQPRCGVEAETSRAACYDDDFAFEKIEGKSLSCVSAIMDWDWD